MEIPVQERHKAFCLDYLITLRYCNIVEIRNHSLKKPSDLSGQLEESIPESYLYPINDLSSTRHINSESYPITTSFVMSILNLMTYSKCNQFSLQEWENTSLQVLRNHICIFTKILTSTQHKLYPKYINLCHSKYRFNTLICLNVSIYIDLFNKDYFK